MPAAELRAYCDRLNEMVDNRAQIKEVHAYTIARPAPETFVAKLSARELNEIAEAIRRNTGLPVRTFD